jgi:DNA processing protein
MMGAQLDYRCRREGQLIELLALGDEELMTALGGKRKPQLKARYAQFDAEQIQRADGVNAVCRHDRRFPRALNGPGSPRLLNVAGGVERLADLTAAPLVAIVGSSRATDYGMEMAKSLARGLGVSGVTVASGFSDGIAVAAQAGALEVTGGTVAVIGGGLDAGCPAKRRSLYDRVRTVGCVVAEIPCGWPARRWGHLAGARILAELAALTVVVEADDSPRELAGARLARELGRTVAAIPGRVTSPASSGTHALLIEGAHLVRGPGDVLELLYEIGAPRAARGAQTELEPRLKTMLERVGAGSDTPEKLTREGADVGDVLLVLSQLELLGLLARGDGGRYVPREPSAYGRHSQGSCR